MASLYTPSFPTAPSPEIVAHSSRAVSVTYRFRSKSTNHPRLPLVKMSGLRTPDPRINRPWTLRQACSIFLRSLPLAAILPHTLTRSIISTTSIMATGITAAMMIKAQAWNSGLPPTRLTRVACLQIARGCARVHWVRASATLRPMPKSTTPKPVGRSCWEDEVVDVPFACSTITFVTISMSPLSE
jgi:hypothetical protein